MMPWSGSNRLIAVAPFSPIKKLAELKWTPIHFPHQCLWRAKATMTIPRPCLVTACRKVSNSLSSIRGEGKRQPT
jgi:hypothetical protein